jgi:hypothetical protein
MSRYLFLFVILISALTNYGSNASTIGGTSQNPNPAKFYIPDANLRASIKTNYSYLFSGDSILVDLAQDLVLLHVENSGAVDFTGIENFTALTTLSLLGDNVEVLPSFSHFPLLQSFMCQSCGISELPDFSGNPNLRFISAGYNSIATFPDLSNNPLIRTIDLIYNNLSEVPDLSALTDLEILAVSNNPITSFPDLSANTKLTHLWLGGTQIGNLPDLSMLTSLEDLDIARCSLTIFPTLNAPQLKRCDASDNLFRNLPSLSNTSLLADGSVFLVHDNRLTFEDLLSLGTGSGQLSVNPQLHVTDDRQVSVYNNNLFTIDLDVDDTVTTNQYVWLKNGSYIDTTDVNQLVFPSITADDAGDYIALLYNPAFPDVYIQSGTTSVNVTDAEKFYIPDANLRASLKTNYPNIFAGDSILVDSAQSIYELRCENIGAVDFTGIENFTGLIGLFLSQNNLQVLPALANFPLLKAFSCEQCGLSEFPDLSANPALVAVVGNENSLVTFPDLSGNPGLRHIEFRGNNLTEIPDLSLFTDLEILVLSNNPITSLPDLSANTKLSQLILSGTQIGELPDLSLLTHLTALEVEGCALTIFPTLNAPELSFCNVGNNLLRDLTPLSNTKIGSDGSFFGVYQNRLTFEDLLPFASLESSKFWCHAQASATDDVELVAYLNAPFTIDLGVDDTVTTNQYIWLKDGVEIDTTNVNQLLLPSITANDAGIYTVSISNPAFPEMVIQSGTITLIVAGSDYFYIPDDNFRLEVMSAYPSAFEGDLLIISQASLIEVIACHSTINDFNGVQFLTNLKTLEINGNTTGVLPDMRLFPLLESLTINQSTINNPPNLSQNPNLVRLLIDQSGLQTFPDISANLNLEQISLMENNISSVPDLSAFTKLQQILMPLNAVTEFPVFNDSIEYIWFNENKVSELPDISYLQNLVHLTVSTNLLTELPALNNPELLWLNLDRNFLTDLPDFSNTLIGTSGSILTVSENKLTFEDLLPLMDKSFETVAYGNQKNISDSVTVSLSANQTFKISLGIDSALTTNVYKWYKNGVLIATGNVNEFVIPAVSETDAGEYYVTVTNPGVPNLTLTSGLITLNVTNEDLVWIADVNLRNCLKSTYPSIFNSEDFVIGSLASSVTDISCTNLGIQDLSGIEVFSNLVSLTVTGNAITAIPDLAAFPNFESLYANFNQVQEFPHVANNQKIKNLHLISNQIPSVPDLSHLALLEGLVIGWNPIPTLPSLSANTALLELNIQATQLATFPDLSSNINLEILSWGLNPQFNTWPELTANVNLKHIGCGQNGLEQIPDLSIYPGLLSLQCENNNLHELPDLSMLHELFYLDARNNDLSSLPDVTQTKLVDQSSQLYVQGNHLTFEDLIPLATLPRVGVSYSPQSLPDEQSSFTPSVGDSFVLDIGVDKGFAGNTYTWYKDGIVVRTTQADTLFFEPIASSDSGNYQCVIKNPSLPELTLRWRSATISVEGQVDNCENVSFNYDDFKVQITSASCVSGGKILIKEKGAPAISIKEYTLEDTFTGQKNISSYPEIVELAEGEYKLFLTKGECTFEWPELLEIGKDQNCHHPVISPNNDGLSEDYYIPFQGQVKIYNREGTVINQFPAPASWNGTDRDGNVVPMGLYIIACEGQKEISITVVR